MINVWIMLDFNPVKNKIFDFYHIILEGLDEHSSMKILTRKM